MGVTISTSTTKKNPARNLKVGLNLKFDYKMQFLFLEKSETSGIEESHDMSF